MSEEKLDLILKRLDSIERKIDPPLHKKILLWVYHNFFTLLLLIVIMLVLWKVWFIVQNVLDTTEAVRDQTTAFIESWKDEINSWKFWD